MKLRIPLFLLALFVCVSAASAQTQLTIRKKSSMKIPGMEMPEMPAGVPNPMESMENRKSTVYIKGPRMRTDMSFKMHDGKAPMIQSTIVQCDKQRNISFSNKKKKYYADSLAAPTSTAVKNSKKGGYVTVTGSVIDTGERAKLFGYDARHLKETITFTPSKNACMKDSMKIETEGWYADIPEFSCPIKRNMSEFRMDSNCFDDVDFQIKGSITGVALKETRKITTQDMVMIMEDETTEVLKNPLSDALFEPPANYTAANTLKEVEDDSPDTPGSANDKFEPASPAAPTSGSPAPTFALPKAGIERVSGPKVANMIRVGIAKVKVTTPESKKDPDAGADIASAATLSLIESLKAQNIEAIELNTDFPENECSERGCDYIFYANVTQKRGGGGMFGKMMVMGAISVASVFVPGVGGLIASTVASQVMSQTMMKSAKAKDEFLLDYKVLAKDKTPLTQGSTKSKTEKDGDDILTPQLQKASASVIAEIVKKKTP